MSCLALVGLDRRARKRLELDTSTGGVLVSEPLNSVGAITMFIADRDRAKSFYEKTFDAKSVYEDDHSIAFKFENMIVNLLVDSEAHGLIGPAVVAGQDAGSRFQLTIGVDDVDGACEDLARRGIELLNGPIDRPWGMRTAAFADPDGHIWEVAAEIPS
jgi:catechol 2,3-dioxygenase-like lactoylglutathione lyase family enzyme